MKPIVEYQSCPFCKGVLKLQNVDGKDEVVILEQAEP